MTGSREGDGTCKQVNGGKEGVSLEGRIGNPTERDWKAPVIKEIVNAT